MSTTGPVSQLLLRWDDLRAQGRPISAEELCREQPELLEEVRRGMQALEALQPVATSAPHCVAPRRGTAVPTEPPAIPGYEILSELGRGGMSVVYQARQVNLKRIVALKMILAGPHAGPGDLARFRAEAEAVARLQHPHIIQIYEVNDQGDWPFLALEFMEGSSLEAKLDGTAWPAGQAAALIETLARAMHVAHQRGIIHRDLKPANVLLTAAGVPKIADFGLAKLLDRESAQTRTGTILGTASYMAPEQASGNNKAVGPAADVYALGAILYELLTGRPPFQADSLMDTLLQVQGSEPVRPRVYHRQLDPSLEAICLKCLEKLPTDRYPLAEALAEDLTAYLQGEPVLADSGARLRMLRLLLRETRHTEVMTQWGEVLVWQAALVFLFCGAYGALKGFGVDQKWLYRGIVATGCLSLLVPVWQFRVRSQVPFTTIERQLAQVWGVVGAAVLVTVVCRLSFWPETFRLFAVLLLEVGIGFGCTAAILGGSFYVMAMLCGLLAVLRFVVPELNAAVYGALFALGLFVPGWKYSRRSHRGCSARGRRSTP